MSFLSLHSCYMFRSSHFLCVTLIIGPSPKEWTDSEATFYVRFSISLRFFFLSPNDLPSTSFSTTLDLCMSRNIGYVSHPYQTTNEIRILCTYFNQFLRKSITVSKEVLPEFKLSLNSSSTFFYHCRLKCKGKGTVHPITGHEGPEGEQMYSSTLPSTSALDGGGWSKPLPGRFTPRKEIRYPLYRRLGEPQGRSGRVREISPPLGFDPLTVQSAASRYTD
jgi:hypothetical protein